MLRKVKNPCRRSQGVRTVATCRQSAMGVSCSSAIGAACSTYLGASCSACDPQADQLLRSIQSGDCSSAVALLHRAPAVLTCRKGLTTRNNVWHCAAKAGKAQVIEALIEFSLSPESPFGHLAPDQRLAKLQDMLNVRNARALTPLMLACIHGHGDAAAALVIAGANPFLMDRTGATPLHLAARNGHADCIRAILSNTPPELARDAHYRIEDKPSVTGVTPLHAAAACNQPECVEVLLQSNAHLMPRIRTFTTELGWPTSSGSTPLHLAADRGHADVVQAILRFQAVRHAGRSGARVDPRWARDGEGLSPFQVASRRRHPAELLELLHPLTDLVATFGVQSLAAPGQIGVPKLSVIAAAVHQAKLLLDVQQACNANFARKSAGACALQQPPGASDGHNELGSGPNQPAPRPPTCMPPRSAFPDKPSIVGLAGTASTSCDPTPGLQTPGQPLAPSTSYSNPLAFAPARQPTAPQSSALGSKPVDSFSPGVSADMDDDLCALCFERAPEIQAAGCSHRLCCTCAESLCGRSTNKPILCPFCRASIGAFCGVDDES